MGLGQWRSVGVDDLLPPITDVTVDVPPVVGDEASVFPSLPLHVDDFSAEFSESSVTLSEFHRFDSSTSASTSVSTAASESTSGSAQLIKGMFRKRKRPQSQRSETST